MARFTLSEHVAAPVEAVFLLFTDLENAPGRVTGITKLELLTPGPVSMGTRFRETRVMFGREAVETLWVSALEPGQSYTVAAESCGMHYETRFDFRAENGGTRVDLTVTARALTLIAWLLTPLGWLMQGMMKKCILQDVLDLKKAAEAVTAPA